MIKADGYHRASDPGWVCVGMNDTSARRGVWYREDGDAIELCSGREGDDGYVRLVLPEAERLALESVLASGAWNVREQRGLLGCATTLPERMLCSCACEPCGTNRHDDHEGGELCGALDSVWRRWHGDLRSEAHREIMLWWYRAKANERLTRPSGAGVRRVLP